jgi:subtilisin family serine protease
MSDTQTDQEMLEIAPPEAPAQFDEPQLAFLPQVDEFLWVSQARQAFGVTGKGRTVAVLDTGLNTTHVDFAGRVIAQRNFTADNNGNDDDATDGHGHGTNVAGIIAAHGDHIGIAPGANVIPLKVLPNRGGGDFNWIDQALQWVIEHREEHSISAVCMSLGDGGNYTSDDFGVSLFSIRTRLRNRIRTLREARVPVVIAAGNDYFRHGSEQGMAFPAILRECVSVGAVYDADEGSFRYGSGAIAHASKPGQITPFSQRLHETVNATTNTRIFAPGAPVTSSGIGNPHAESVQHGTSQATPVVTGLILLMQELYLRLRNELPTVDDLILWLQRGGVPIFDGDDENDNVQHTRLTFTRADALSALDAVRRHLQKLMLEEAQNNP